MLTVFLERIDFMRKSTRMLALIGAILLAGLYISTLIFALINSAYTLNLLKASIAATIILPVLLYAYILVYRLSKHSDNSAEE